MVWTYVLNGRFPLAKTASMGRTSGWLALSSYIAPRKQWKNQVAADVTTHLPRRLYRDPLMAAVGMTAERGAWRGLRYDITGINLHRDQSSERAHPDVSSVIG